MPRSRHPLPLFPAVLVRSIATNLTALPSTSPATLRATLAAIASLALVTATAGAQGRAAADTPLHLAVSRFEFKSSGDAQPLSKPLAVHNGGSAQLTDVRLTRLVYADSSRGAKWLVAVPRQSAVAPDELATVGTLCVDATGLAPGTYRATAAVRAREVPEPVAFTITLVVTGASARPRDAAARCGTAATK
ncbi:MAG: hypothetical protein V4617_01955 [Gemmatimonadota bacterium]